MTQTVLVVDDEAMVTEVVGKYLRREGYEVVCVGDGDAALAAAQQHRPDLVVLDLMLPRVDGLEVCRKLRARSQVPVIMLTAKGEELDRIIGLELGADDYIPKPFSPRELVARVKAVLRRAASVQRPDGERLDFGELAIDVPGRVVWLRGQRVELTAKEFDLLHFLAGSVGRAFTREELLNKVWDYEYFGDANTVTVHVRRLRSKIETDPARPAYVKTVWGIGYKFEA
ncbi:MAG TPA: response regulator transcription factor [Dehalococcoidia bacterium]|nr:response regulator transcription factor [Dehalococcoidia bacterium]